MPMMALAALPLFGFVGAAIDYSRARAPHGDAGVRSIPPALMLSRGDAQTNMAAA